jgi:hypothetical protein
VPVVSIVSLKRYWVEARTETTKPGGRVAIMRSEMRSSVTVHPSVSAADAWPLRLLELRPDSQAGVSGPVAHYRVERVVPLDEVLGGSRTSVEGWLADIGDPTYWKQGLVTGSRTRCEILVREHARRLRSRRYLGDLSLEWVDSWRKLASWRRRPLSVGAYSDALLDERDGLVVPERPEHASLAHAMRVHSVCVLLHVRGPGLLRRALLSAALSPRLGGRGQGRAALELTETLEPILEPLNLWLIAGIARSAPGSQFVLKTCREFLLDIRHTGPELFAALAPAAASAAHSSLLEVASDWLAVMLPMCELVADQTAALATRTAPFCNVWEPLANVLQSGVMPLRVRSKNTLGLFAPTQQ